MWVASRFWMSRGIPDMNSVWWASGGSSSSATAVPISPTPYCPALREDQRRHHHASTCACHQHVSLPAQKLLLSLTAISMPHCSEHQHR